MNVRKLVEENEQAIKEKKDYDLLQHLKLTYLPFAQKMALAQRAVNATSYVEVDGVQVYRQNTPSMMLFFTIGVIEAYTDITFEELDKSKEYDALVESGLLSKIMKMIPSEELNVCHDIFEMTKADLIENSRSLVSYLETKSESLLKATTMLADVIKKENLIELLSTQNEE